MMVVNLKRFWKEFWEAKHRHSYTHSAEAIRHNKIVNCGHKELGNTNILLSGDFYKCCKSCGTPVEVGDTKQ